MKKAFFLLSLSSIVSLSTIFSVCFANTKSESDARHFTMTADRSFKGLEIGGSLLYFQPGTSSDLVQYAVIDPIAPDDEVPENNVSIQSDYETGYDLFGRYYFGNGRDVIFRYTHFDGSNSDMQSCNATEYTHCTAYPSDEPFNGYAEATIKTNFNAVDLLLGQRMRIGDLLKLRLFAGLTVAHIKMDTNQYYEGIGLNSITTDYDSDYKGVGPKVGLEGEYELPILPVSLYMGFSGAGLIGESKADAEQVNDINDFVSTYVLDSDDQQMLVPNLNVDVGVRYQYIFTQAFAAAVLVGYRASEYFNAVRKVAEYDQGNSQVDDTADFSLNGLYVELSGFF